MDAQGLILTNNHVVEGAGKITVQLSSRGGIPNNAAAALVTVTAVDRL